MPDSADHSVSTVPAVPRLAASTVLVRDGAKSIEVLLIKRSVRPGDRHGGGYVFPGGMVDPADRTCYDHCDGLNDVQASARLGLREFGLDLYIAGIRECFEEVGVLLVEDSQDAAANKLDFSPTQTLALRRRLLAGEVTFHEVCNILGLRLSPGRLAYQAHWLTPSSLPKRFDTRFFIVEMPSETYVVEDGTEATAHCWIAPAEALERAAELALPNPTRAILRWLLPFVTATECVSAAHSLKHIQMVTPVVADGPQGMRAILPHESAYAEVRKIDALWPGQSRYAIESGRRAQLSHRVYRLTAPNPGVMTGPGTNTYFVRDPDSDECAVIDPGPDDPVHIDAILRAAPCPIRWILATHTHHDHSPAASLLAQRSNAEIMGMPPPNLPRQDSTFSPRHILKHDDVIVLGPKTSLRVFHTPGHASNHLCYMLPEERVVFSGDHVMQGSTVVIGPPDGNMAAYIESLRRLLGEDIEWLAPGHGFLIAEPRQVIEQLIKHRLLREESVMTALRSNPGATANELLDKVYSHVPSELRGAAGRSLLAHLQKLESDGRVALTGDSWSSAI